MNSPVFFLDMDGVVTNFVGATFELFGLNYEETKWPLGIYDIEKVMNISSEELWKKIDETPNFWGNLPELEQGLELFCRLSMLGSVVFLTSPCKDPNCSTGKVEWLLKKFGSKFRNYILTSKKHYCAGNGILIDDSDEKVDQFRENAGISILYPQPWNSNHEHISYRNNYVLDQIKRLENF